MPTKCDLAMSCSFVFRWASAGADPAEHGEEQRDFFLEMKRAEDASYSCFTKRDLYELSFSAPFGPLAHHNDVPYGCDTQNDRVLDRVFLGKAKGTICLWKPGSTLNWIARRDGYPSPWHAQMALRAAHWATREWNEVMDGRVVFRYVDRFDDACFKVEYGGKQGDVFAKAFFPDDWKCSLNTVRLFRKCFEWGEVDRLRNVMLHELGHVLGMRHEHAQEGVEGLLPAEDLANGPESMVWGNRNAKSVMAYYKGQSIQKSDVEYIRKAYDELEDGMVICGKGRFGMVKKVVERVVPNN